MKKGIIALMIGMAVTFAVSAYSDHVETDLSGNVIRLHVIANSDSDADQALKIKVRDEIIAQTGTYFAQNESIAATRGKICAHMDEIAAVARGVLEENGCDDPVNLTFGPSDFPTKAYGNITLPAGTYEALRVEIGEASGQNWWCVLFPPLCFVDATTATLPPESERQLKSSLDEESYDLITRSDELPVEVRFKAYEMWQNGKMKLKTMLAKLD